MSPSGCSLHLLFRNRYLRPVSCISVPSCRLSAHVSPRRLFVTRGLEHNYNRTDALSMWRWRKDYREACANCSKEAMGSLAAALQATSTKYIPYNDHRKSGSFVSLGSTERGTIWKALLTVTRELLVTVPCAMLNNGTVSACVIPHILATPSHSHDSLQLSHSH